MRIQNAIDQLNELRDNFDKTGIVDFTSVACTRKRWSVVEPEIPVFILRRMMADHAKHLGRPFILSGPMIMHWESIGGQIPPRKYIWRAESPPADSSSRTHKVVGRWYTFPSLQYLFPVYAPLTLVESEVANKRYFALEAIAAYENGQQFVHSVCTNKNITFHILGDELVGSFQKYMKENENVQEILFKGAGKKRRNRGVAQCYLEG